MTDKPKKVKKTRAQLERQILELKAQMASTYAFAYGAIPKCGEQLMASGVLVQLTALGGREIVEPFVVRDGLSKETIDALRKDIDRSYSIATIHSPIKDTK